MGKQRRLKRKTDSSRWDRRYLRCGPGCPDQLSGLAVAPGAEVDGEEGVEAGGQVIDDLARADAAETEAAVFDLDCTDE